MFFKKNWNDIDNGNGFGTYSTSFWAEGGHSTLKISSYQYRNSHYKDKIVMKPFYPYKGNPYTCKHGPSVESRSLVSEHMGAFACDNGIGWRMLCLQDYILYCQNLPCSYMGFRSSSGSYASCMELRISSSAIGLIWLSAELCFWKFHISHCITLIVSHSFSKLKYDIL